MLLTCPTCRSGLEVPEGTTALVRCPACKTVFSPADGLASPEPEPEEEEVERPKPARKAARPAPRKSADEDDEDEKPRKKTAKKKAKAKDEDEENEDKEDKAKNRDFDPEDPEESQRRKKKRRSDLDDKFSPEEREALRRAFDRAAWGCKLIWISLALFMLSMVMILAFWFQAAIPSAGVSPGYVVAAGVIGAIGWALAAVGVGLCLSGPRSPGHWGYGIAAAVVTVLHLLLLLILVTKGKDYSPGRVADRNGPAEQWGLVPTRLDAVTYYLTVLVYKDQELIPKGELNFSIVVGLLEMIRTTLILMLVSCLAQAAGDKELHHKCTRAAGFASFGPGFMALGMLAFAVAITETRAGVNDFTKIIFTTVVMGTYSIINATILPCFMAARETAEACEEPFQAQQPKL